MSATERLDQLPGFVAPSNVRPRRFGVAVRGLLAGEVLAACWSLGPVDPPSRLGRLGLPA